MSEAKLVIPKVIQVKSSQLLRKLMNTDCGVDAAILTTEDGFEIAVESVTEVDSSKLAAMASSLSAIGNMSVSETNLGTKYYSITIESDRSYILIMDMSYEEFPMILNVVASKNAVLGQVLYHANRVVNALTA